MKAMIACLLALVLSTPALGQERLLLVGGGVRPPKAMERFVEWAGGAQSHILVIAWPSSIPGEYFEGMKADLLAAHAAVVKMAPQDLSAPGARDAFLAELSEATGVFFTGGDQSTALDLIEKFDLRGDLRERFEHGIPFGGTSAGTALLSTVMMTGDDTPTRLGLDFMPHSILDMHFLKRDREKRLTLEVLRHPDLQGIGIDEDTALLAVDGKPTEVIGRSNVIFVSRPMVPTRK